MSLALLDMERQRERKIAPVKRLLCKSIQYSGSPAHSCGSGPKCAPNRQGVSSCHHLRHITMTGSHVKGTGNHPGQLWQILHLSEQVKALQFLHGLVNPSVAVNLHPQEHVLFKERV